MQEPIKTIKCILNGSQLNVNVYGNVDKLDGFYYYTFRFDEDNFIVISKLDGQKWQIVNMTQISIAGILGRIIDELK